MNGDYLPILVKEIMSTPVLTIDVNKTALDVGKLLRKHRKGFIVVIKKNKPVGVISDSDLIGGVICKNLNANKVKVQNIMHEPIISVGPEDDILTASKKMKSSNIHRLPVVEKQKVVGVVSLTDIAQTSPEMLDLLEYRLKMKEKPFEIKERSAIGICDSCDNFSEDLQSADNVWLCESCREEQE